MMNKLEPSNFGLCYTCKHIQYDGLYNNGYCDVDRTCKITDSGCKIFDCEQFVSRSNNQM